MKKKPNNLKTLLFLIVALIGVSFFAYNLFFNNDQPDDPPIYSEVQEKVADGQIKSLEILPLTQSIEVTEKKDDKKYVVGFPTSEGKQGLGSLLETAEKNNVQVSSKPIDNSRTILAYLTNIFPILLLVGVLIFFAYSQGLLGNKVNVEPITSNVKFNDVAGCGEAVEELQEVRQFLADPNRFESLGATVPKGILLYGPPGTGKTLLAKAVANEAGIPFFACAGSDFTEMYVGVGAKRVRSIFKKAKKIAPSIIFIDELDAVGGKRTSDGDGGSREANNTLMQILNEMDGFSVSENPVIVMAATNRTEALDQALVRPGRFDRHIAVDPPDRYGREQILEVHSRNKPLSEDVDLQRIAIQTSGMTGADLALLLNEAALLAARRGGDNINRLDIDNAFLRIVAGAEKQHRSLSEDERQRIAYHETGHAIVREFLKGSDVVHKISIIPRGKSGGQTIYVSEEDVFLHSQDQLKDKIASLLAGRAAEEIIFNEISSGAADDLQRASALANQMYSSLGMGKTLGLRVKTDELHLSDIEQRELDSEIKDLLQNEYQRAKQLITDQEDALISISQALLEEEVMDRERFLELLEKTNI
jgi:cell division protease FtsH